jgi:hypothetical protein
MDAIPGLCRDVFPWISNQATRLGLETQDNRFAQLGGELFILSQQIPFSYQAEVDINLVKVAVIINKACSVSERSLVCTVSRTTHRNLPSDTLTA